MIEKFLNWIFGAGFQDATDDELPAEARRTWDNLDDAFDEEED
jgi:hypothetical protein